MLHGKKEPYKKLSETLQVSSSTIAEISNLSNIINSIADDDFKASLGTIDASLGERAIALLLTKIDTLPEDKVREALKNIVALQFSKAGLVDNVEINRDCDHSQRIKPDLTQKDKVEQVMTSIKKASIISALGQTDDNITHAAKLLGMTVQHLRRLKKKYGI